MATTVNLFDDDTALKATNPDGSIRKKESLSPLWNAVGGSIFITDDPDERVVPNYFAYKVQPNTSTVTLYIDSFPIPAYSGTDFDLLFHAQVRSVNSLNVRCTIGEANQPSPTGRATKTDISRFTGVRSNHVFIPPNEVTTYWRLQIDVTNHGNEAFYFTLPVLLNDNAYYQNQIVQNLREILPTFYWDIDSAQTDPDNPLFKLLDVLSSDIYDTLRTYVNWFDYELNELSPPLDGTEEITRSQLTDPVYVSSENERWLSQFTGRSLLGNIQSQTSTYPTQFTSVERTSAAIGDLIVMRDRNSSPVELTASNVASGSVDEQDYLVLNSTAGEWFPLQASSGVIYGTSISYSNYTTTDTRGQGVVNYFQFKDLNEKAGLSTGPSGTAPPRLFKYFDPFLNKEKTFYFYTESTGALVRWHYLYGSFGLTYAPRQERERGFAGCVDGQLEDHWSISRLCGGIENICVSSHNSSYPDGAYVGNQLLKHYSPVSNHRHVQIQANSVDPTDPTVDYTDLGHSASTSEYGEVSVYGDPYSRMGWSGASVWDSKVYYTRIDEQRGANTNANIPHQGKIVEPHKYSRWGFSVCVSDDGETIAVGAPNDAEDPTQIDVAYGGGTLTGDLIDINYGSVTVFDFDKTTYARSQRGQTIYGPTNTSMWGKKVDLSRDGNVLIVSGQTDIGIYVWTGTSWVQRVSPDLKTDTYGEIRNIQAAISQDGRAIVVAAMRAVDDETGNSFTGSQTAQIFDFNGVEWLQRGDTIEFNETVYKAAGYHGNPNSTIDPSNNPIYPDFWAEKYSEAENTYLLANIITCDISGDGQVCAFGYPSAEGGRYPLGLSTASNVGIVRVRAWNSSTESWEARHSLNLDDGTRVVDDLYPVVGGMDHSNNDLHWDGFYRLGYDVKVNYNGSIVAATSPFGQYVTGGNWHTWHYNCSLDGESVYLDQAYQHSLPSPLFNDYPRSFGIGLASMSSYPNYIEQSMNEQYDAKIYRPDFDNAYIPSYDIPYKSVEISFVTDDGSGGIGYDGENSAFTTILDAMSPGDKFYLYEDSTERWYEYEFDYYTFDALEYDYFAGALAYAYNLFYSSVRGVPVEANIPDDLTFLKTPTATTYPWDASSNNKIAFPTVGATQQFFTDSTDFKTFQLSTGSIGYKAGSRESIIAAVQQVLTGDKIVALSPNYAGNDFRIHIRTVESETPDVDPVASNSPTVLAAAELARPLGFVFSHVVQDAIYLTLNNVGVGRLNLYKLGGIGAANI